MTEDSEYQSPSIALLATALSAAQGEMTHAGKGKENPHFRSKYADLSSVIDALKPALVKHGLAYVQTTRESDGHVTLVTTLAHKSGEWIRGFYPVRPVKSDPQGLGSAMSYARRYALAAITGVAAVDEDDDGNAASGNASPTQAPRSSAPPAQETRLQQYNAAKDEYRIPVPSLPDGSPDYDAFVADLETELQGAKNMNDASMLKKANAATLNALKVPRPDLFEHAKSIFTQYSNALA